MPEDIKKEFKGCLIYTRVSTDRQAEEGYSLDEQERSCREFAKKLGYKVLNIYREEGESGTSMNRPKFKEMLERCSDDKGMTVKAVIVIHTDRFARNTLEHLMVKGILQKSNVKLLSVLQPMIDDSPEGNLMDILLAGMNEFYSKDLGRKTARALAEKAKTGHWPGFAPLGYLNVADPETNTKRIEIDKEKSWYIKEAFRRFATGRYTVKSLNDELFNEGFRSRTGKKIAVSIMNHFLKNIFYAGKMMFKSEIYEGKHTPLVDMETYLNVQRILGLHNHATNRARKHNFLLSGLLFCGECSSQLTGEKHLKRSGLAFDYYRCMGPKHKEKSCQEPFVPAKEIEDKSIDLFKNISLSSSLLNGLRYVLEEIYRSQNQKDHSWLKTLENRKAGIVAKMNRLEDLFLDGFMARERTAEKYLQLKEELKAVEEQIGQTKTSGRKLKKEDIEKIINFLKTLDNTYAKLSEAKKKLFLKLLVSKIYVRNKQISQVKYTPIFQSIIDKDLVRITTNWLPLRELIRTLENLINTGNVLDYQVG